jgi:hypothetical protein
MRGQVWIIYMVCVTSCVQRVIMELVRGQKGIYTCCVRRGGMYNPDDNKKVGIKVSGRKEEKKKEGKK